MESETKKLHRLKKDRMISGVSVGIAKYFNIDPTLIRIVFILLILFHGFGILLYLILTIVIPGESEEPKLEFKDLGEELKKKGESLAEGFKEEIKEMKSKNWWDNKRNIVGLIIIVIGFIFFLDVIIPFNFSVWSLLWPFIIICIGFYLIFKNK